LKKNRLSRNLQLIDRVSFLFLFLCCDCEVHNGLAPASPRATLPKVPLIKVRSETFENSEGKD